VWFRVLTSENTDFFRMIQPTMRTVAWHSHCHFSVSHAIETWHPFFFLSKNL